MLTGRTNDPHTSNSIDGGGGMNINQCHWHWGHKVEVKAVMISHNPRDKKAWQGPYWFCASCREHLRGLWKYAKRNGGHNGRE